MFYWIDKRQNGPSGGQYNRNQSIVDLFYGENYRPYRQRKRRNRRRQPITDHRSSNSQALTHQPVPDHAPPTSNVEYTESSNQSGAILSIYIKIGICVAAAIVVMALKLYFDNVLTGLQLVTFGSLSVIFFGFTLTISDRLCLSNKPVQTESLLEHESVVIDEVQTQSNEESMTQPESNSLITEPPAYAVVAIDEPIEPPPSYAIAAGSASQQPPPYVTSDEGIKHDMIDPPPYAIAAKMESLEAPPPSYDKINIV